MKYYVYENSMENGAFAQKFENIMENGALAQKEQMLHFPYYFKKYSKLSLNSSWIFSMLYKNRKWCHDLKIAYVVKG